jgi:hypothetical protein
MKCRFLILGITLGMAFAAHAQTSIFTDGKGESAYKLFGNAITVNTSDASVSAALNVLNRDLDATHTRFNRTGINISLNAKDGLSNIKSDDGFLINGSIGLFKGWKRTSAATDTGSAWAHEYYLSGNFLVDRNKLYDLSKATDKVYDQGNAGWKIAVGKSGYCGNWLYGMEVNFGQSTNAKDLKQLTVSTLQAGSTDSVKIFKEQQAFSHSDFLGAQFNVHANADIAYGLNAQTAANNKDIPPLFAAFHFRYETFQLSKPQFNPALGFYIASSGKPRSIVGGFLLQETDLFNVLSAKNSSFGKRIGISFTAGFNL